MKGCAVTDAYKDGATVIRHHAHLHNYFFLLQDKDLGLALVEVEGFPEGKIAFFLCPRHGCGYFTNNYTLMVQKHLSNCQQTYRDADLRQADQVAEALATMQVPVYPRLPLGCNEENPDSSSPTQENQASQRPDTYSQRTSPRPLTTQPPSTYQGPTDGEEINSGEGDEEDYFQYVEKDYDTPPAAVGPGVQSSTTQPQTKTIARWEPMSDESMSSSSESEGED